MNEIKESGNLIDLDEGPEEKNTIDTNVLISQINPSHIVSQEEISGQLMDFSNSKDKALPNLPLKEINSNHLPWMNIPCLIEQLKPESLLNDPFETKPVSCLNNNPFDLLENEVSKYRNNATIIGSNSMNIKTAKLLALSDDELLSNDEEEVYQQENNDNMENNGKNNNVFPPLNLIDATSECNSQSLLPFQSNSINCNDISVAGSDSTDLLLNLEKPRKKNNTNRTRLLKLSVTNSATSLNNCQNESSEDFKGTPISKKILQRSLEPMLSTESPLKLMDESDSDEDHFEADLKLLTIPMLNEIDNTEAISPPICSDAATSPSPTIVLEKSTNFEAIKAKLNSKRSENVNYTQPTRSTDNPKEQDINLLIRNLQSLISKNEITNESRKNQATELLDKLCNILSTKNVQHKDKIATDYKRDQLSNLKIKDDNTDFKDIQNGYENILDFCDSLKNHKDKLIDDNFVIGNFFSPPPIKREGTFDIELSKKSEKEFKDDSKVVHQTQNDIDEPEYNRIFEIPNCMISSSATYDGDTNEEKAERLNLPEIAPFEHALPNEQSPDIFTSPPISPLQPDVNEIVEQLGKLLSQQTPIANSVNPATVIVVMNTPTTTVPKQNLLQTINAMEPITNLNLIESLPKSLPDLEIPQSFKPRRRSQSLSTHDKMQIFQFPLQPVNTQLHSSQDKKIGNEVLLNIPSVSPSKNLNGKNNIDLNTPRLLRRNSYSNGSRSNFSGIGRSTTNIGVASRRSATTPDSRNSVQIRPTLLTAYEGVVTTQAASIKLPTKPSFFKPDVKLKKPVRQTTESIMSSSKPLKATIPVKKVAPSLATSTVTTTTNSTTFKSGQCTLSKMDGEYLSPKACSTPAATNLTDRRNSFSVSSSIRSRHSLAQTSASPIIRSNVSSSSGTFAASGTNRIDMGLKRRSITDFKAKSPIKPRVSSTTMSKIVAANSTTGRLSNVRAVDKLNAVKETSKITRLSGSFPSYRNKENRRP